MKRLIKALTIIFLAHNATHAADHKTAWGATAEAAAASAPKVQSKLRTKIESALHPHEKLVTTGFSADMEKLFVQCHELSQHYAALKAAAKTKDRKTRDAVTKMRKAVFHATLADTDPTNLHVLIPNKDHKERLKKLSKELGEERKAADAMFAKHKIDALMTAIGVTYLVLMQKAPQEIKQAVQGVVGKKKFSELLKEC